MKCISLSQAVSRYGAIDFASAHWSEQNQWMEMIEVPLGLSHLLVGGTKLQAKHIYCNKDMSGPLLNALDLVAQNWPSYLSTYEGCFNIRPVRGTVSSPSCHSYGLAIDLNASENPLGSTHGGFYDMPSVVKCFTDQGFDWGGAFHGRKDPMHFSYAWE